MGWSSDRRLNKYGNRKTHRDGHLFDSVKEADRYSELKLLERAGTISQLELQPRFPCQVNGTKVCSYVADFKYVDLERGGGVVVEDVKGYRTDVYRLKKKLVEAIYGIEVIEV